MCGLEGKASAVPEAALDRPRPRSARGGGQGKAGRRGGGQGKAGRKGGGGAGGMPRVDSQKDLGPCLDAAMGDLISRTFSSRWPAPGEQGAAGVVPTRGESRADRGLLLVLEGSGPPSDPRRVNSVLPSTPGLALTKGLLSRAWLGECGLAAWSKS